MAHVQDAKETNECLYEQLKYRLQFIEPQQLRSLLFDEKVMNKIIQGLTYYEPPTAQSSNDLRNNQVTWLDGCQLSDGAIKCVQLLSRKINLKEKLAFDLVQQQLITNIVEYQQTKQNENPYQILQGKISEIITLYYKEKLYLLLSVIQILMLAQDVQSKNQHLKNVFFDFVQQLLNKRFQDIYWQYYQNISNLKTTPQDLDQYEQREQWWIQLLYEQQYLSQIFMLIQRFQECDSQQYQQYLNLFIKQEFNGSSEYFMQDLRKQEFPPQNYVLKEIE